MLSVNTNYSAMVALQNLNSTNNDLEGVQQRISTGLKVANAKDNGAVFAIAEGQRSRVASIAAVKDGVNRASSAVDVALSAGQAIGKALQELNTLAVSAQAEDLSPSQRNAVQANFSALRSQITTIVNSATFNGINLLERSRAFRPTRSTACCRVRPCSPTLSRAALAQAWTSATRSRSP
jgi:flagellin